jgi:hypothetical protein
LVERLEEVDRAIADSIVKGIKDRKIARSDVLKNPPGGRPTAEEVITRPFQIEGEPMIDEEEAVIINPFDPNSDPLVDPADT